MGKKEKNRVICSRFLDTQREIEQVRVDVASVQDSIPEDTETLILAMHTAIEDLQDENANAKALNNFLKVFIDKIELIFDETGVENGIKIPKLVIHYK